MSGMQEHKGPLIGNGEARTYAYESENARTLLVIQGHPSPYANCDHSKTVNPDFGEYSEYELSFSRHTANSITVTLKKKLSGNAFVETRKQNGEGTVAECFTTTLSFADIANRLLGPGCQRFEDTEALPDSVKAAMRRAYDQ